MTKSDEVRNFKIDDPKIKECIMETKRTQISSNEYKETVGNKTFNIKIKDKSIIVSDDNNNSYSINLKGKPAVLKKLLTEQNSRVLFQIAKKGIKLNWYDAKNPKPIINPIEIITLGEVEIASYDASKNEMNLKAENISTKLISRSVAHETGHSFWNSSEYKLNEEFKQVSSDELEAWKNSDEPFKVGAHTYCCYSIDELFAECYSLVVTGHSQSEYTIAKYFPRTLAIVKKMIEND